MKLFFAVWALFLTQAAHARPEVLELGFREAEQQALASSNRLKAALSDANAAREQADAQYAALFPRVSLDGNYRYISEVPRLAVSPAFPPIQFGAHSNYSIGPALNYTLWDTGTARKSYRGALKLAEARDEDRKNTQLQLLFSVRSSYVRVLLALEELRLVNDTLRLARAQNRDVTSRYQAGAATRLDLVTSGRQTLNYELQFAQRQAALATNLKDLLALVSATGAFDIDRIDRPGPPNVENVSLVLKFDSFQKLLAQENRSEPPPPDGSQPQIQAQSLLSESLELAAASQRALLYPTVQLSAKATLDYPNGPIMERVRQNTVALTLSMPLFEAERARHLAAERVKSAEAAQHRRDQVRLDMERDFTKTRVLLNSLREQQKLAAEDVERSEEAARLFYDSYKAGKVNLTDVQSANVQALQSKVNAARIDAQILDQINALKALSGKEVNP
ncbi:MAG: hypothetical protein A2428_12235 [Bdellovibrionales bacterium RIFOXYC1_FULL_54_43]|nr:MAG: hypothetical protein A2428_12235 [Bdellovibrionales bacterium RIFOXYC1_FULL_54_43]OFZ84351.1 MAG: hypothetical protein A2603_07545 [Bdellovibrionales bacterium RIFOXYD1_FULL_55_31]